MARILYISSYLFPAISGDSIFSQGLLYRLSKEHDLKVISFGSIPDRNNPLGNDLKIDNVVFKLRKSTFISAWKILFLGSVNQIYSKDFSNKLKEIALNNIFDYILIDHLRVYYLCKSANLTNNQRKEKVIFLDHNVEFLNQIERVKYETNILKKLYYWFRNRGIKKLELQALKSSDIQWFLTYDDKEKLSKFVTFKETNIIPSYFPFQRIKRSRDLGVLTKNILILGSFHWFPNKDGVMHFLDDIFPIVKKIDASYRVYIVGQRPPMELLNRSSDDIKITGKIESIEPYVKNSDLLVIPNRKGTGIKIKLMEAIMKGLPVIMYEKNISGYPKDLFNSPFIVSDEQQFADSIVNVNNNFVLKERFVENAIEYFNNNLNYDFKLK